jgi:hypothetical protein
MLIVKSNILDKYISILYQEWDGLTRIAFNRKNKTLGSEFKYKHKFSN